MSSYPAPGYRPGAVRYAPPPTQAFEELARMTPEEVANRRLMNRLVNRRELQQAAREVFRQLPKLTRFGRKAEPLLHDLIQVRPWKLSPHPAIKALDLLIELYPILSRKGYDVLIPNAERIAGPFTYGFPYNGPPTKWEGFSWYPGPITDQAITVPDNLPFIDGSFSGIFGVWTGRVYDFARFAQTSAWRVSATAEHKEATIIEVFPTTLGGPSIFPEPVPYWAIPKRIRKINSEGAQPSLTRSRQRIPHEVIDPNTWNRRSTPWRAGEPFIATTITPQPGGKPPIVTIESGDKPRTPPPARTRERKAKSGIPGPVKFLANIVTEPLDALSAVYDALPESLRKAERRKRHGKDPSPENKLKLIYQNWDKLDMQAVVINLAKNEVEDRLIANINQRLHKNLAPWYNMKRSPLGVTVGPAL